MHKLNMDEADRLRALASYKILDTPPEKEFDDITKLAAAICDMPISTVAFIDEKRKWHKSKFGTTSIGMPREYAICSHTILKPNDILVVPDSRKDERFSQNPFVQKDPRIIFYAGVPLTDSNGSAVGTLCVIDHKPREITQDQIASLKSLANQVVKLLELRRKNIELSINQAEQEERYKELEKFAYVVAHDIKSPLANIASMTNVMNKEYNEHLDKVAFAFPFLHHLNKSSNRLISLVDGILNYYKSDSHQVANCEEIDLHDLVGSVVDLLDGQGNHAITYSQRPVMLHANRIVLEQVFINLIGNGIKYNDNKRAKIDINYSEDTNFYYFTIQDNGVGISLEDQEMMFNLFTNLGRPDRDGAYGSGIGLSTVKKLIEKSRGTIEVKSELGTGSIFRFSIKKNFPKNGKIAWVRQENSSETKFLLN